MSFTHFHCIKLFPGSLKLLPFHSVTMSWKSFRQLFTLLNISKALIWLLFHEVSTNAYTQIVHQFYLKFMLFPFIHRVMKSIYQNDVFDEDGKKGWEEEWSYIVLSKRLLVSFISMSFLTCFMINLCRSRKISLCLLKPLKRIHNQNNKFLKKLKHKIYFFQKTFFMIFDPWSSSLLLLLICSAINNAIT